MELQTAEAIYGTVPQLLNAAAQKAIEKPSWARLVELVGNACAESDQGLASVLQGALNRSLQTMTIGELIDISPLQMQNGLSSAAVSKLIADPANGLAVKLPQMLELQHVVELPSGERQLAGGNNRNAIFDYIMRCADIDDDSRYAQEVEVLVTSVNMDGLKALYPAEAVAAFTTSDWDKIAKSLLERIWQTSNGSRNMTASEVSTYNLFKDVPRNREGVRNAFQQGDIKAPDAFRYLAPYVSREIAPPSEDSVNANVFPADFYNAGAYSPLTVETVDKILKKAFATAVDKTVNKAFKADGLIAIEAALNALFNVEGGYATTAYVTDGTFDADGNPAYTLSQVPASLFQRAIDSVNKELVTSGDKYANNIARNAQKIGERLGNYLQQTTLFGKYAERTAAPGAVTVKKVAVDGMWSV
jgi:hypothetical protein